MKKIFKDIMTCADKHSYDNGRVLCLMSFVVYFLLAIISSLQGHPWLPMEFSGGISAMAIGFGINLRLKRKTEPKDRKE